MKKERAVVFLYFCIRDVQNSFGYKPQSTTDETLLGLTLYLFRLYTPIHDCAWFIAQYNG